MDPLPGKVLVRAFNVGAQGSMQAAGAPWQALGGLGEMIAATGEKGIALLNKHKELQIQREAADMEVEFAGIHDGFEREMLQNPNMTPEQAIAGWEKRMQSFQAKYQREGMSPLEQDVIGTRSKALAQRGGASVAKSSLIAGIQNTKQAGINLAELGIQTGDMEKVDKGLAVLKTVMPEADVESFRMKAQSRIATNRIESEIMGDPLGMRDSLDDPDFVKNNPGVAVDDVPRLREMARTAARRNVGDAVDEFGDDLATGKVKTAEDIDRLYGGKVPPRIAEDMKGHLARRYDTEERERMKSPEAQMQTLGQATGIIAGIGDTKDFEAEYSKASFLLDSMKDSPAKRYYSEKLRAAKDGRQAEAKSQTDLAMKALEDFDKRAVARLPEPMSTTKAINDGFLRNKGKLKALGFTEDQIAEIWAPVKLANDKERDATDNDRRNRFEKLWEFRNGESTADGYTRATALAIVGQKPAIENISPENEDAVISARIEFDREAGARKAKLLEWMEVNPDASRDQIEKKLGDITGEQFRGKLKAGILETRANDTKGASESTSAVPVGKNLAEIVKNFEAGGAPGGFHEKAYWDYGQWSIGYGTKAKEGEKISKADAEKRLATELAMHRGRVETYAAKAGLTLNAHEADALTSFDFNTGRIEQLLANGQRSKAEIAAAMLLYRNAGGERLRGLEKRRAAEQQLFLNGYKS